MITEKRKKASGPNIPDWQRRTVKLHVRVSIDLAIAIREVCAARGLTMGQVFEAGVAALEKPSG